VQQAYIPLPARACVCVCNTTAIHKSTGSYTDAGNNLWTACGRRCMHGDHWLPTLVVGRLDPVRCCCCCPPMQLDAFFHAVSCRSRARPLSAPATAAAAGQVTGRHWTEMTNERAIDGIVHSRATREARCTSVKHANAHSLQVAVSGGRSYGNTTTTRQCLFALIPSAVNIHSLFVERVLMLQQPRTTWYWVILRSLLLLKLLHFVV